MIWLCCHYPPYLPLIPGLIRSMPKASSRSASKSSGKGSKSPKGSRSPRGKAAKDEKVQNWKWNSCFRCSPSKDAGPTRRSIVGDTLYSQAQFARGAKAQRPRHSLFCHALGIRNRMRDVPLWYCRNLWHWQQYPTETCSVHESDWRYFTACMLHPESALGWITGDNAQWSFLPGWDDGNLKFIFILRLLSVDVHWLYVYSLFQVSRTKRVYP